MPDDKHAQQLKLNLDLVENNTLSKLKTDISEFKDINSSSKQRENSEINIKQNKSVILNLIFF